MAWPVAVEQAVQPFGEYEPEDTDPEAMSGTLPHGCSALLKEWLRAEANHFGAGEPGGTVEEHPV